MNRLPKIEPEQTQLYNALGGEDGDGGNNNFFVKKANSIGNAFGTTAAAIASPFIND